MRNLFIIMLFTTSVYAQTEIVEFDTTHWTMVNAEVSDYLDRKCLSGTAYLNDVEFQNGVIEVDIAVDGRTSYPGVLFRMQDAGNYERFYIRPHRSNLYPDVLQYVPAFNGIDSWQLYSGEGFTTMATVPTNQWNHLKIEFSGTQARVYWNHGDQPALRIHSLKHGQSRGKIGFDGPRNKTAYFSNFTYREDDNLTFDPPPEFDEPVGIFKAWELSQPFAAHRVDLERTPEAQGIKEIIWQKVRSDSTGLVDISHYYGRSSNTADCVFARMSIHSDADTLLNLKFGYSDAISIFLNGQMLFFGNSAYRGRDPSFLGIVGFNDAVYLPLKRGENEIILAIAESFGGWGFKCTDGNAVYQHEQMSKAWEIARQLNFPESVVYDGKRNCLYVSNFYNSGKESVSRIGLDGRVREIEWVTGVNRPSGLTMHRDRLYAVDRANLIEIDPAKATIVNKYPIPGAAFPNDVAFDSRGNAYISDTRGNRIYRFANGKFETWLQGEEVSQPNGVLVIQNELFYGNSGDGTLRAVNLSNKVIRKVCSLGEGSNVDGIKSDGRGNLIVSDFNGRVFLISADGVRTKLLDTRTPQQFCADLEYIPEKGLLFIPALWDNRLVAYQLRIYE